MKRNSGADIVHRRWKLLKEAILEGKPTSNSDTASVRRFTTFGLVQTEHLRTENDCVWYRYEFPIHRMDLEISHCEMTKEDVMSFNNTGNVCVWPAEEVLTSYCLENVSKLKGLRICELGGGMTCLAGVAVAKLEVAERMLLTDGNEKSVQNVAKIINQNDLKAESRTLRWDVEYPELEDQFDLVISADCLFFDKFRSSLVETLDRLLTNSGEAWIFAPTRDRTLSDFVHLAGEKFVTSIHHDYDKKVSDVHKNMSMRGREEYDANLHYPLLVKLFRKVGKR